MRVPSVLHNPLGPIPILQSDFADSGGGQDRSGRCQPPTGQRRGPRPRLDPLNSLQVSPTNKNTTYVNFPKSIKTIYIYSYISTVLVPFADSWGIIPVSSLAVSAYGRRERYQPSRRTSLSTRRKSLKVSQHSLCNKVDSLMIPSSLRNSPRKSTKQCSGNLYCIILYMHETIIQI